MSCLNFKLKVDPKLPKKKKKKKKSTKKKKSAAHVIDFF